MKKRKLLIGALLAFSLSSVQAQTANQLGVGVKGGYNFNQFDLNGATTGGHIGGFVRYSALSFLSVQAEVLYDLQGGERQSYGRAIQESSSNYTYVSYSNRTVQLHTLSVPLSVRLSPASSTNFALNLVLGGSFDWIFGAIERRDATYSFNGYQMLDSDATEGVAGDLGSYQISAHIGAALDFILDDGRAITYEMRYRQSFTNLNETVTLNAALTEDIYSSSFIISVYYPLPIF